MWPIFWLIKKYNTLRYGEERAKEIEAEEEEEYVWTEFKAKRANALGRAVFLFLSQGMLASLVMAEILFGDSSVWSTYASDQWIVFSRFMCGIVLHVSLSGELNQGLNNMKYAVNHPWKFNNYKIAWFCGFMQAFNVFVVETVNFAALLTNFTIIEIIMNFLALVVIAEFDEYFFNAVKTDPLASIVRGEDSYADFLVI